MPAGSLHWSSGRGVGVGGRPAVLAHSQTCPIKMPRRLQGVGFVVSSSSLYRGLCVAHWSSTMLVGGEKMTSPYSLVPREGILHPFLSKKPLQKSRQSPVLCPRLLSDPCPHPGCVRVIGMPGITVLLCFISGMLRFQTPNLKGPGKVQTHFLPLNESLAALCLVPFCPRKAVTQLFMCLEFILKHNEKLWPCYLLFGCASVPCW